MVVMKRNFFAASQLLTIIIIMVACAGNRNAEDDYTNYVEPRIGTAHCRWFHFTPGALPFGMAKPAPSTNGHLGNKWGWEASGYDYRDSTIEGFPCLHEFQIGGIVLMPTNGDLVTIPGKPNDITYAEGYQSAFSHSNEVATAGYYCVLLDRYNIKAELTSTKRVAYQRFTYPSGISSLIFDIGNRQGESGAVRDAYVAYTGDGKIEGWVVTEPEYVKKYQPGAIVPLYFSAEVDVIPDEVGCFRHGTVYCDSTSLTGEGAGLYFRYDFGKETKVTAKIGLSYTSVENARVNLETESRGLDFESAKKNAHNIWQEHLSRIAVETPVLEDKIKFYTGLYHAILGRGLASDCNGFYPNHDGGVSRVPLDEKGNPMYNMYNTDADWGGQWNLSQLWALAYPEYFSEHISSHLRVYEDSGWLGDGLACSRYVSGVGTNLLGAIISGAYQCGIKDWDTELGYKAVLKNELEGENRPLGAGKVDTRYFVQHGYVPHRESGEGPDEAYMFSVSHTLEASYSAWAVAQWAKERGDSANYRKLMWLSDGWDRVYDPATRFVRPRYVDGKFLEDFNPMQIWRGFQEGNAWQYTFYVPHNPEALVAKLGQEIFNSRLDSIFSVSQKLIFSGGTEVGAFAGLQTLYNQGNQPCLHTSWLFNHSGRPSLTQKWVRAILNEFYGIEGIHGYGYGQDEDQGQLGAWYAICSLGLFDVKGLTASEPAFSLGSPIFDKITIRLNSRYYPGDTFTIIANNGHTETSCETIESHEFVQSYKLNGQTLHSVEIPFESIVSGGVLEVEMGDNPCDSY